MLLWAMNSISKSVTVDAFWMDQTEITNNKYRQFVYYVRDSILRTKLGNASVPDRQYFMVDKDGNVIEPNVINWDEKIDPERGDHQSYYWKKCIILPKKDSTGKNRLMSEN